MGSLYSSAHIFQMANPNAMKPLSLETRLFQLSKESRIIEFGSQTREICPFESGLAAGVNAINAKGVYIESSCYGPLLHSSPYKLHSPFLPKLKECQFKWEHASSRLLSSFHSSKHQPDTPLDNRVHAFYSYLYFALFSFVSLHKYACIF